jgi:hypothetical protein
MAEYGSGRNTGIALAAVASLLSACGGGGDSTTASSSAVSQPVPGLTQTPASDNPHPATTMSFELAGTPQSTARAGAQYDFTPVLQPADAAATYSISNKPAWASFDTATGELSGTPASSDVGSYANVSISASVGDSTATLTSFAITVDEAAVTGTATLSWLPPTEHTDGSSVTNLGGYNIYHGTSAESLSSKIQVTNPGLTTYVVSDLGAGTHYFAVTAYTAAGIESEPSFAGSKTIM